MSMPNFTAEASFYQSNAQYQGGAMLTSLNRGNEVLVHPSARKVAYCSMKGCCVDLRDIGFPRVCCRSSDGVCGTDVLI